MNAPKPKSIGALGEAALLYESRGWSIIPIRHRPVPGGAKKPAIGGWKPYQTQRADPNQLREWFAKPGLHGLAVILGAVSSNLCCRDFDAADAYHVWAGAHPELAKTLPTVQTARGFHVYFTAPGVRVACRSNGELRGEGGYVLLPPSTHPNGHVYQWIVPLPDGPVLAADPVESGLGTDEKNQPTDAPPRPHMASEGIRRHLSPSRGIEASDPRVQEAIRETLPAHEGQREGKLWGYIRRLKAFPELRDLPASRIRTLVMEWHQRALPTIDTKPWADTWAAASRAWGRAQVPHGGTMESVIAAAREAPVPQAVHDLGYADTPELVLLVMVCRELQRRAGSGVFMLSCRTAGKAVGVSHKQANEWLTMLIDDDVLDLVEKGRSLGPGKPGSASRWRCLIEYTCVLTSRVVGSNGSQR